MSNASFDSLLSHLIRLIQGVWNPENTEKAFVFTTQINVQPTRSGSMSSDYGPSRREAVVEARYFLPIETKDENLRKLQNKLSTHLEQEGFIHTDVDLDFFGPAQRSMDLKRMQVLPSEDSFLDKVKGLFQKGSKKNTQDFSHEAFLDALDRSRDDMPFRLVFYFKPVEIDDQPGYDVLVESTPFLLQKFRQLDPPEDYSYNLDDVVEQNKAEIRRTMGRFGVEPYSGPHTQAEIIEPPLLDHRIEKLEQHRYGRNALRYIEEGDQCLQQDLRHAALSCYIHAIEWTILYYKIVGEEIDLVEEQQSEGKYFTFDHLVSKVRNGTPLSQKTISKLENINAAERRWAAHHKTGEVTRKEAGMLRDTLFRLIDELIVT